MCGRYTTTLTIEELMLRFFLETPSPFYEPRYNIAPGQMIPAIINDGLRNKLGQLHWGLIPSWAKDPKIGNKMINARMETLTEKPAFRMSFQRKRCIVPADSFFEWKETGKGKQPMRIMPKEGGWFAMAAIYDTWISPEGEKVSSCAIITTASNTSMEGIHDRMPVLLRKEDETTWLGRSIQDTEVLLAVLQRSSTDELRIYPVSKAVGNVKNDSADNIKEVF
jgi:putative SOS response-associated peptidase YedK